jgi:hypothetical protein
MAKFKVTLYETSSHEVEIETPVYYKLIDGGFTKYYHVFEKTPEISHANCFSFYEGELYAIYLDRSLDNETTKGEMIEEPEYLEAVGTAYDVIAKLLK